MRSRVATALFLEFRTIPVLLWSFTAVSLGTAVAVAELHRFDPVVFALSMAVATLIQGFATHAVNEIYDWNSGTDSDPSPRLLSGGSRVLTAALLSPRGLWAVFWVSSALIALTGAGLVALRGPAIAGFIAVGYFAGLAYTLPPVSTSYRPFLGEWAGGFLGVFAGGLGAYYAQAGTVSPLAIAVAGAHAFVCVGMLLVHHDLDLDADGHARPPKRTTVVALGFPQAKVYTVAVAAAAIPLFGAAVARGGIPFALALTAAALGLVAHVHISPREVASVTRGELRIIQAGVAGGIGTSILLAPVLWPLAPLAVIGYFAHLRVGARFATASGSAMHRAAPAPAIVAARSSPAQPDPPWPHTEGPSSRELGRLP